MHFPLSLLPKKNIKGGKVEGEGVGKNLHCKTLRKRYIKHTVDVDFFSIGGSNHLKNFLCVIILLKHFCYFSLPHHTLEVRISSLVQIIHQQIGARRRA